MACGIRPPAGKIQNKKSFLLTNVGRHAESSRPFVNPKR